MYKAKKEAPLESKEAPKPSLPIAAMPLRWRDAGLLLFLLALAVATRVFHLAEHSVTMEEYGTMAYLALPGFRDFMQEAWTRNAEHMPLYFVLEFLWGRGVGASPAAIRMLSVSLGLLTLPFVYLLGRDTFGRRAGGIAAACFALSPLHIFFDQTIRPYSLLVLLATVSLWTFLRAVPGHGRSRWVLHFAANVLLMFSHVFGALLIVAEGLFLLLQGRKHRRTTLAWGVASGTLLALVAGSLLLNPHLSQEDYQAFRPPTLNGLLFDMVGDQSFQFSYAPESLPKAWYFLPEPAARLFASVRKPMHWGLLAVTASALVWLAWQLLRPRRGRSPAANAGGDLSPRAVLGLMGLTIFLPPLTLVILSFLWFPCYAPRYVLYNSVALYVVIGAALGNLSNTALRRGLLVMGVVLYAYHALLTLPPATRTDWRGAARQIAAQSSPGDWVLVGRDREWLSKGADTFLYNLGAADLHVFPVVEFDKTCAAVRCALTDAKNERDCVWAVYVSTYVGGSLEEIEACFTNHGLAFERTDYPAMRNLAVYRIHRQPPAPAPTREECKSGLEHLRERAVRMALRLVKVGDYRAALATMAALRSLEVPRLLEPVDALVLAAEYERPAVHALYSVLAGTTPWPGPNTEADFEDLVARLQRIGPETARRGILVARIGYLEALAEQPHPDAPSANAAYYALQTTTALLLEGDTDTACRGFRVATQLDGDFGGRFAALAEHLCESGDDAAALAEAERLQAADHDIPTEVLAWLRQRVAGTP